MIDVGLVQSFVRKGAVNDRLAEYGHVIFDECHHVSAHSFEQVLRRAKAKYVLGLSATITRSDGHHPIIFMQCGPVREASSNTRIQFHQLNSELAADEARNRLICEDIVQAVREGRSPIVLTERNEHLDRLSEAMSPLICNLIVLRGGMQRKVFQAVAARLLSIPDDEERVLLATGRYIGEGFDDARLDTLFLTMPVSWRGTVAQYVGRLHRLHDRKREVRVYD